MDANIDVTSHRRRRGRGSLGSGEVSLWQARSSPGRRSARTHVKGEQRAVLTSTSHRPALKVKTGAMDIFGDGGPGC